MHIITDCTNCFNTSHKLKEHKLSWADSQLNGFAQTCSDGVQDHHLHLPVSPSGTSPNLYWRHLRITEELGLFEGTARKWGRRLRFKSQELKLKLRFLAFGLQSILQTKCLQILSEISKCCDHMRNYETQNWPLLIRLWTCLWL